MTNVVKVRDAAEALGVKPQAIYHLIKAGRLKSTKPEGSRSQCVVFAEAKQAIDKKHSDGNGRVSNWEALTAYLKGQGDNEVAIPVDKLKHIVDAPSAKLEMLHYWDPYRAQTRYTGQGPGVRAIQDAGFEIKCIEFSYIKSLGYSGAISITMRRLKEVDV